MRCVGIKTKSKTVSNIVSVLFMFIFVWFILITEDFIGDGFLVGKDYFSICNKDYYFSNSYR